MQKSTDALDQLTIGKTRDQVAEPDQGSQHSHHALIAEVQSCGVNTVGIRGRSGHLGKMATSGAGCASAASASHRRRLADSPTARRACQF
jgi:hypothetical protein